MTLGRYGRCWEGMTLLGRYGKYFNYKTVAMLEANKLGITRPIGYIYVHITSLTKGGAVKDYNISKY